MKILIVGGGGREHAIAWKISLSPRLKKLYCAPGNTGTAQLAENIDIQADDIKGLADFASKEGIDLTVVGPELPLTRGIADEFESRGLKVFGPNRRAAELEGSKVFSKEFMKRHSIPTARYEVFDSVSSAKTYIRDLAAPVVVKADGLAAGKGVLICRETEEALRAVDTILSDKKFGPAGDRIVVEELLEGDEVSFMALTDGENYLPMISASDHKQVYDGNKGPNTGGMGAYAPAAIMTDDLYKKVVNNVIIPTVKGMASEGIQYKGVLYAGLMICGGEPFVLEFNCRFGDPETQPVLMKMKSDIVPVLESTALGNLKDVTVEWHDGAAVCVVMASGGYPGNFEKGLMIKGLEDAKAHKEVMTFHAGTALIKNNVVTNGGRVLGVTALGKDVNAAADSAYEVAQLIHWDSVHYRKDIGKI